MRTPTESAALAAEKARIAYVDPPAGLVPVGDLYDDGPAWRRLYDWFEEHGLNGHDAVLVFLAERRGWSIPQAYIYSDSWGKRIVQPVDDDGYPMSFN